MVLTQQEGRETIPLGGISRFHTTMVLTQLRLNVSGDLFTASVSIPLWFLRNLFMSATVFHNLVSFHTLWFLRNAITENGDWIPFKMFPYHYGSHATRHESSYQGKNSLFPYHYGSHATFISSDPSDVIYAFPYHYGSHATGLSIDL